MALRANARRYGAQHEVLVQNVRAKRHTAMRHADHLDDYRAAIAVTPIAMAPKMRNPGAAQPVVDLNECAACWPRASTTEAGCPGSPPTT